jgi:hypothetical protein
MKKTLFSIATLGLVTFFAIRADAQNLYGGARIGANLANQNSLGAGVFYYPYWGAEDNPTGIRTGFLAGLQLDRYFSDTWGLSAELFYDQKGAHREDQLSGTIDEPQNLAGPFFESGTSDVTLNYLECALLLKARFGSGVLRPYVFAGPSMGLFLSGKRHDNVSDTYTESSENYTVDTTQSIPKAYIKTFDVSVIGGAGIELKVASNYIVFLDAAYTHGFTNIVPNSDGLPRASSRDIRLAAGILFPLD